MQIFSSAVANEFSKNKQKNNQKEVQHMLIFMKLMSVLQPICMWVTPAYIVFAIPTGKGMLPFLPLNFLFLLIHAFDLMLHFNSKLLCCVLFCFFRWLQLIQFTLNKELIFHLQFLSILFIWSTSIFLTYLSYKVITVSLQK